jgi:hypothetical protein
MALCIHGLLAFYSYLKLFLISVFHAGKLDSKRTKIDKFKRFGVSAMVFNVLDIVQLVQK